MWRHPYSMKNHTLFEVFLSQIIPKTHVKYSYMCLLYFDHIHPITLLVLFPHPLARFLLFPTCPIACLFLFILHAVWPNEFIYSHLWKRRSFYTPTLALQLEEFNTNTILMTSGLYSDCANHSDQPCPYPLSLFIQIYFRIRHCTYLSWSS